jgi:hypothetical protein
MGPLKIEATFDREAGVWYVCESNVPGLATEAASLDELAAKLAIMIPELLRAANNEDGTSVPFALIAHHVTSDHLEAA